MEKKRKEEKNKEGKRRTFRNEKVRGKKSKALIWLVLVILAILFVSGFLKRQGFQFFIEKEPFSISFGKISPINLIIVEDEACVFCQTAPIEKAFGETFKFLKISKISKESSKGKKIIEEQKISVLPAFVFSREIEKDKKGKELISSQILKKGKGEKYLINEELFAGTSFFIRDLKEKQLDLFMMSECPFGVSAANTIISYLKDNPDKGINLNLHYILDLDEEGKLVSLHGEEEVKEDLRQIVIQKYFNDKLFDYILLRNKGKSFEEVATELNLNIDEINSRVETEGVEFGKKEISLTNELGIAASPTVLWENRYRLRGVDNLSQIKEFSGIEEYFNRGTEESMTPAAPTGVCE